jgi:ELWxxDGT repeat protein
MIHDYYVLSRRNIFLLVVLLLLNTVTVAQIRLVADLKPGLTPPGQRLFSNHVSDGTRAFFVGSNNELWTSNGTTEGTKPLKRFFEIQDLIVINGVAYFRAKTETHGFELWKSNGTTGGTVLVKDILPGRGDGNPWEFQNLNGTLYFTAYDGINGRELWKSDGTSTGTMMVKDIIPGPGSGVPNNMTVLGNKLMFSAYGTETDAELWTSDGTAAGTMLVKDIFPGTNGSYPTQLRTVNDNVFFVATSPEGRGQLWKSNGTAAGTTLVKQLGANPRIANLTNVAGTLYFEAYQEATGSELWKSDGTSSGTYMVTDFTPGTGSTFGSWFNRFTSVNGKLFFTYEIVSDYRIGMSDGTPQGTKQISLYPANPIIRISSNASFYEMYGAAYLVGIGQDGKVHLFKCDMNGVITKVEHAISTNEHAALDIARIGNLYYFFANNSYWRSDGTSTGTWRLRFIAYPAGSQPAHLTDVGGTLFFQTLATKELWKTNGSSASTQRIAAADTVFETEGTPNLFFVSGSVNGSAENSLWRSDGSASGTFQLRQYTQPASNLKSFNGRLYYSGTTAEQGAELWSSDGTVSGTTLVQDINPGSTGSAPQYFTQVGEYLYFSAKTSANGIELWRANGQATGTQLVKDVNPGSVSSTPMGLTSFRGKLYFSAYSPTYGWEVWQSGGDAATTNILKDVKTGDELESWSDIGSITATKDYLYFTGRNANNEFSLWRSNGTPAGTMQVAAFAPSTENISLFTATETHAYFFRTYNGFEFELWSAGTGGIKRLRTFPGQVFAGASDAFAVKQNILYFTTIAPRLLWRTDGTIEGTYQIDFVGQPKRLATSGSSVYLSGIAHKEGDELFIIEESISATTSTASLEMREMQEEIALSYPNPFAETITVRVNGAPDEKFHLRVVSNTGVDIESAPLDCGRDHTLGASWSSGLYILQIRKGDKVVTRKVIKTSRGK